MSSANTIKIPATELLFKDKLLERWTGATVEEIAIHIEKGDINTYKYHKGPIGGYIWCVHVVFIHLVGTMSSRADRCRYIVNTIREHHFYFKLEDIIACERRHPEYALPVDEPISELEAIKQKMSALEAQFAAAQHRIIESADTSAPVSTGSRKDENRIAATRQACETIRQGIDQGKHLFGNGKTNRKTFFSLVGKALGNIPIHQETALAEWKNVPGNLKHNGRVSDNLLVR